jgi:hypothetical protein
MAIVVAFTLPSPSFIHISGGKMGDALALDLITPEAGAIYVMDRCLSLFPWADFRSTKAAVKT